MTAATLRATMLGRLDVHGDPFKLALLTGLPTNTAGVWDISAVEVTGTGYGRATLAVANLSAASGYYPVIRDNTAEVAFPANTGTTNWPPVSYLALLNGAGTSVLAVAALGSTLTVGPQQAFVADIRGLMVTA